MKAPERAGNPKRATESPIDATSTAFLSHRMAER